jgi:hypothetical protein
MGFPPPGRMDDGSNFNLPVLSKEQLERERARKLTPVMGPDGTPVGYVDEHNRILSADDPFAMMDALAKIYPDAKFTEEGALVLHRQEDKDGKIFELRANNSGKKAIVYTMRWTDPETGEFKEYQHKDDRHSIAPLLTKANGPQGLLDRLMGRVDNDGFDWANIKFGRGGKGNAWGPNDSLSSRLGWLMSGTGDRKKMEEIGDNAVRLADGRNVTYHTGTKIVKNSELPSLWNTYDEFMSSGTSRRDRDVALKEDMYDILYSIFGSTPLGEKAHANARKAIRAEFRRRNPNASQRSTQSFDYYVSAASERMRGIYRNPDSNTRSIRYASKDMTKSIEKGMTVEYTNNVGETSILKVSGLVQNVNATPGDKASYDYGDYVLVVDANGNTREINALKLRQTRDQDTPLTDYTANLQGQALAEARRDPDSEPIPAPRQRAKPVGTDTVISAQPSPPMLIDDVVQGDMLHNKEGRPLGIVKTAPRPVTSRDGSPALAFLYTGADGVEGSAVYKLGTEVTPKKA